jgi:NAD(P)-dependent dehydrogenase (short-subunit alcohol dehydrogenase family)
MKDKIVLITGATSGIGKATAMALAKQGAHVIIHGRSETKLKVVQQEIISVCGHTRVDTLMANLFLLSEVRRMAASFNEKYDRLDVLINNAGVMMGKEREETSEGREKTIAINLLAPVLLTTLLMDMLRQSSQARIINVSSSAHKQNAKPDFNDWECNKRYGPFRAYGNAKLFLILYSQRLAKQLPSNITVNTLHPGAIATNFSVDSNLGGFINFSGKIARRFFKTAEQGADTVIYLASSPEVNGVTGEYFIDRKQARVGAKYNTERNEGLVWEYCMRQIS